MSTFLTLRHHGSCAPAEAFLERGREEWLSDQSSWHDKPESSRVAGKASSVKLEPEVAGERGVVGQQPARVALDGAEDANIRRGQSDSTCRPKPPSLFEEKGGLDTRGIGGSRQAGPVGQGFVNTFIYSSHHGMMKRQKTPFYRRITTTLCKPRHLDLEPDSERESRSIPRPSVQPEALPPPLPLLPAVLANAAPDNGQGATHHLVEVALALYISPGTKQGYAEARGLPGTRC